jgi:hypothetical protein
MSHESMVKVELQGPDGDVETPWATPLGGDRYRLENSPFWAYGVSYEDVIEARASVDGGFPSFVRRLQRSGNRTLRVILKPSATESSDSQGILDTLVALGCSYEGLNPSYLAINVPPAIDLAQITAFLIQTQQQWEYVDPTYAEVYGEDGNTTRLPDV